MIGARSVNRHAPPRLLICGSLTLGPLLSPFFYRHAHAQVSAAEYKAYEAAQAKNGGLDPLEAQRQKAKQAQS